MTLCGPLTIDTIHQQPARAPATDGDVLVLDLSQVSDIDSAAVALLLEWRRQLALQNRSLLLKAAPASLLSLIHLYSLETVLQVAHG